MKSQFISFLVLTCLILAACANQEIPVGVTPTPELNVASSTPDPCAAENLEQSIKFVNDLMREFTDAYRLASNVAKEQVPPIISDMQRIRRAAEDQQVPACLTELKSHQLAHMNTLVDVMLAFVSGAEPGSLTDGLSRAQTEYDLYTQEMASLLGIQTTVTAAP